MTRTAHPEPVRITLLGGFRVAVGSRLIEETAWPLRKAARVVKLLALAPGHRQHRGRVLDLLWPDLEPAAALNNLHGALHAVRRVLEPDLTMSTRSAYLCLRDDVLILCPEGALWLDMEAFEAAGAAARRGAQDPAAYEAALALYGGDLLPQDRYEDWAARRREDVRALYLSLLADLAQVHEARHEYAMAVATLEQVVAGEPTQEDAHVALMRLYALLGQRSQALRQYQQLRDALRHDLDAEPGAASRQLYHDILAGRRAVQRASGPASGSQVGGRGGAEDGSSPSVFRLPPSAHRGRTNLPLLLTSFIGREREVAEVTRLLATTRLLTLTGTGGCGKTRLALQVAADLVDAYPDGVWLVELASLADPRLVLQAWAAVLGVREEPGRALGETLADALRPKHLLVVLDNCEHLLDAHAHLAEALLQDCPHLHILATSREALNITGEGAWRVPSLALPASAPSPSLDCLARYDAVRLFLERARASRLEFALTPQNAPAVVQVCRRLEGIPLALELAAARLTVLSVEQLAARMDACLGLLTMGRRTALPRQQTLRATLDWSYGHLSHLEQVLFRRLAVFAGAFALEAAEGVCTGAGLERAGLLDLLTQLVNKSLLLVEEQEERASYRLLETLRQYGMEKLEEAGEAAEVGRRHAEWYLALAETAEPELVGPAQAAWLAWLEVKHDNLRAVLRRARERAEVPVGLRLAGALWRFWYKHGHLSEGLGWLEEFLSWATRSQSAEASAVRVKALTGAGILAYSQGDYRRAAMWHEESLALRRDLGDLQGVAGALADLGHVAHCQGDLGRATALYEESLAVYRRLGDTPGLAHVLTNQGDVVRLQGDYARAAALCEESLQLYRGLGDTWGIAAALNNRGMIMGLQGDYECATAVHEESLVLRRALGDKWGIAHSLTNLGDVARDQGAYERAAALHEESVALRRELRDRWGIASSLQRLGRVAHARGDHERAARLSDESLALCRDLQDPWGQASALTILASVAHSSGDQERALALYAESLTLYQRVGNHVGMAGCLEGVACVACMQGKLERATRLYGAAAGLRAALGAPLPPADRRLGYERDVAGLHAALGDAAFAAHWAAGRALPLEQASAEALEAEGPDPAATGETPAAGHTLAPLTRREHEIALLLAAGHTDRQIAAHLALSARTVSTHVSHILAKRGLASRAQVAAWATAQQLHAPGAS